MLRLALLLLLSLALLPSWAAAASGVGEQAEARGTHLPLESRQVDPDLGGLQAPRALSTGIVVPRATADSHSSGMRPHPRPGDATLAISGTRIVPEPLSDGADVPCTCEELPYHATAPPSLR